jgi:hypothetical protein
MRRAHPLLSVLLLAAAAACGTTGAEAGAPAPLSLPTPPDEGTAARPAGSGSGIAGQLVPAATPEYLRGVGEATRKLATGRVKMVVTATGARGRPAATELSVLEGRWDSDAHRSSLRLDPTGATRAGGSGVAGLFSEPVQLIQIGETHYLQLGGPGRGWTKLSGNRASAVRPVFDLFQVTDIEGFLGALGCAAPVADAGTESLEGVRTNHYRIEAASAAIKGCTGRDANAGGLLDNLGDSDRATVDVWVDEGSLVRKVVVTSDEKALGAGLAARFPGAASTLTMTLSGFAEPVDIQPPPADELAEDDGLGGLGDLLGGDDPGGDDLDLDELLAGLG